MRRAAGVALLVVLHATIVSAQATSTSNAPTTSGAFGKVAGLVFDSLLMRPLAGATVWIPGTDHSALADARGRFVFERVATGRQQIAFTSSGLDSAGLEGLMVNADVVADKTTDVQLTSPSRARLWSMLCAARPKLGTDSGIAFGSVHDGETNARLAQASVTFTWYNLKGTAALGEVTTNVRTDSIGVYYACGLPVGVQLASQAYGNHSQSGEVQYHIGARQLLRQDLVASTEMTRATRGTATVRGVVVNELRAPVSDALVYLSGADTTVRSGGDGSFVFRNVPAGSLGLEVRKVGTANRSQIVNVRRGEDMQTAVVMSAATTLATVNVGAERPKSAEMTALEDRQKMGFGMMFDFTKDEPSTPLTRRSTCEAPWKRQKMLHGADQAEIPALRQGLYSLALEPLLLVPAASYSIGPKRSCVPDVRMGVRDAP
jgi:Carboxypeptidase regulatory-like domain